MAAIDLCTTANVREFLQKPAGDTNQDTVIASMITRASRLILTYTEREFAPTVASETRTFEYDPSWPRGTEVWISLAPYDLRTVASVTVDTDEGAGTALASTQYRLWPRPNPQGTFTALRIDPLGFSSRRFRMRQVQIAGAWGFSTIPEDVVDACVKTVALWLRRDVAAFERTFSVDEERLERPQMLPSAIRSQLDLYKRQVV